MKNRSATGSCARLVVTTEYSRVPSSGEKKSSWEFVAVG
jgi:hypothetical protein